jgi:L-aspartate oxidase
MRLRALLEDRYPLARLIAASCLAREESRGAHQRVDHPQRDPALDGMHTLVGAGLEPAFERWE